MWTDLDATLRARILPVRLMVFDVDGVLTDGRVIYHDDGSEIKAFDVHDGHGIKLLQRAGIDVALITGRSCRAVEHRAAGSGDRQGLPGRHRQAGSLCRDLQAQTGLRDEEIGFMGDDLIDIPLLRRVGFAVVVPNAVSHVMPYAHYVTRARGGHGAAREVCELLLGVQGLWEEVTRRYFGDRKRS